ncbi:MAG: hypothetical protein QOF18_3119 [Frankiaceae bacterium]|nr:hypothetical protein [Frankiaceae bacterium]
MSVSVAASQVRGRPDRWLPRLGDLFRAHPELVTVLLCGLVLAVGQRGPDLPAQVYRVFLFRQHGLVAFDSHWYAGHPLPGYSLLFPPLAAVIGPRLVGALACIAATAAFTRLLRGSQRTGHDLAVLWFAVVSVVDLVVGRLPFALGLAAGIGALVTARDGRRIWTLLLALACGCASPLAGAFLLLAGVTWLPSAGWRRVLPFAGAAFGIAAAAAFGEGGWFPFPATTLLPVLALTVGGLLLVPRSETLVRRGLLIYGLVSLALFMFRNPIGGNMVRLGAVFAGPLLAYELVRAGRRAVLAVVSVPLLIWQFSPLPTSLDIGQQNPSAHAGYYRGLLHYLVAHGGASSRLEVPLTNARWESDYLATKISLARGWERQVDLGHNSVLYDDQLTAGAYHDWLLATGVRWVALPDVKLDASETGEKALLTGPTPSYLRPAWHDAHWKLWEVRDARSLVSGPATLVRLGVSTIDLQASAAGTAIVLVRWTRFWRVTTGDACVAPTADGWTQVQMTAPGPITLTANVGLGSLTGAGQKGSCSQR